MCAYSVDMRLLAHLSDLHIGRGERTDVRARGLCRMLQDRAVDHVVVSGDVTHRGRRAELAQFRSIFAPWIDAGRLSVVPGNHDRLGDDVSADLMGNERVAIERLPGLFLVRFDSSGPHNRSLIAGHGEMTDTDLREIGAALDRAPASVVVALLMHHHPLPLPHDSAAERMFSWLGWSSGEELAQGGALTAVLRGRCDLVLHGHRHLPSATVLFPGDRRSLALYNAGSSTELRHVRVFAHRRGRLAVPPLWMTAPALRAPPMRELVAAGFGIGTAAPGHAAL
jgi:3',5'-cyclic-AMP phosphodiesterase